MILRSSKVKCLSGSSNNSSSSSAATGFKTWTNTPILKRIPPRESQDHQYQQQQTFSAWDWKSLRKDSVSLQTESGSTEQLRRRRMSYIAHQQGGRDTPSKPSHGGASTSQVTLDTLRVGQKMAAKGAMNPLVLGMAGLDITKTKKRLAESRAADVLVPDDISHWREPDLNLYLNKLTNPTSCFVRSIFSRLSPEQRTPRITRFMFQTRFLDDPTHASELFKAGVPVTRELVLKSLRASSSEVVYAMINLVALTGVLDEGSMIELQAALIISRAKDPKPLRQSSIASAVSKSRPKLVFAHLLSLAHNSNTPVHTLLSELRVAMQIPDDVYRQEFLTAIMNALVWRNNCSLALDLFEAFDMDPITARYQLFAVYIEAKLGLGLVEEAIFTLKHLPYNPADKRPLRALRSLLTYFRLRQDHNGFFRVWSEFNEQNHITVNELIVFAYQTEITVGYHTFSKLPVHLTSAEDLWKREQLILCHQSRDKIDRANITNKRWYGLTISEFANLLVLGSVSQGRSHVLSTEDIALIAMFTPENVKFQPTEERYSQLQNRIETHVPVIRLDIVILLSYLKLLRLSKSSLACAYVMECLIWMKQMIISPDEALLTFAVNMCKECQWSRLQADTMREFISKTWGDGISYEASHSYNDYTQIIE